MTNVDSSSNGSRREQRLRRGRRWKARLLIAMVVALLVTGTAYAFTGPLRSEGEPHSVAVRSTEPSTSVPTTATARHTCRAPLDPMNPLRLWIGGDSLAGSLGPSLGQLTGATGVVQPVFNSRVSSGLTSPEFYDWPKHVREDLLQYNPEVAVFVIGTNDAKTLPKDNGQWEATYSSLVDQMMTLLTANGRPVFWIGAPIMKDDALSEHVKTVNRVFQGAAVRHPEVTYVDAYTLFSGPDGKYAPLLSGGYGKPVHVRAGDGVHFTPEGGDLLSQAVFGKLDPQCGISTQAVPSAAKLTIEVKGSSQIPGTHRAASTTAPARPTTAGTAPRRTAPPATAPPSMAPSTSAPPPSSAPCVPPQCTSPGHTSS